PGSPAAPCPFPPAATPAPSRAPAHRSAGSAPGSPCPLRLNVTVAPCEFTLVALFRATVWPKMVPDSGTSKSPVRARLPALHACEGSLRAASWKIPPEKTQERKMPFCKVEKDVRIYYETFGSGSPIVFVHGGGCSHEFWEQQVFHFADHYRTVAIDLRGHGESDKPATGYTFDRMTKDLEAVVKHLKLGRFALVCHAVGGYVGMKYALRN